MLLVADEERDPVKVAVTVERVSAGWLAFAPEIHATAQGSTHDEAVANLLSLVRTHPDLLADVRHAESRRVELVAL